MTTFYFDPVLGVHHRVAAHGALTTAFYAAPQVPADARRLFDAGCASAGMDREQQRPLRPSRAPGSSLLLAREWEMADLEARLSTAIEDSYGPTWNDELGEFTWTMGLDEPHPRGQFNAFLAAAEAAGPGRWERLSAAPLDACAKIVGVDFPAMALRRAAWIDGNLHLGLAPRHEAPTVFTSFRVVGAEPRNWEVHGLEGVTLDLSSTGLEIRVPMVDADVVLVRSSY